MDYIITVLIAESVKDKKPLCDTILSAAMAFASSTSPITTSKNSSETDLNINSTEDEIHMDISNWTPAQKKKLQHMTEFHKEYQWIFGEKASISTIMKRRISCMNPPIPTSVCEEEMQSANMDAKEVVIEYITDAQGNKVKRLKPLLIKSEPDREYVQHIHSDDNLPVVPKENFLQKREVTVDSYSETNYSNLSSDDSTITADSDSSAASSFKETPCKVNTDTKGIEAILHQIASGLQSAADSYITLASHMSEVAPYDLLQVIAQIPPPPMDVPIPVRKALTIDGENKVFNYLLCGEYELNKTSWSKLQKNIMLVRIGYMLLSKEKEDQEVPNIIKRRENRDLRWKLQHPFLTPYMINL